VSVPRARSSFIGREAEIAAIARLIEEGVQLVTILGPPGIGKTRLALRFATLGVAADEPGALFCDLTDARSLEDLFASVAGALNVMPTEGGTSALLAQLGRAMSTRGDTLLVLDNAESITNGVATALAAWLDAAPTVVFLVTSRERLRIEGERVLTLDPLQLPPADAKAERVLDSEAVQLLVDRARAVRGDFQPTAVDAANLARIVERVEGVPLAIELCAARLGVMGPAQLLARLDDRLDILTSDRRDNRARHASLRQAVEWSWQLLEGHERTALARCAVFRGGFDPAAAEEVLDLDGSRDTVLAALTGLQNKSLLRTYDAPGHSGEVRLGLLESVRQFASEQLESSGDRERIEGAHTRFFLRKGTVWLSDLDGPNSGDARRRLILEKDNLLAVYGRELGRADGVRAILALRPVFGSVDAFLEAMETALARVDVGRLGDPLLGQALLVRGRARFVRGQYALARADFERVRGLEADPRSAALARTKLAVCAGLDGDFAAADALFGEAERLARGHDEGAALAAALNDWGVTLGRQRRLAESFDRRERALAAARAAGARLQEAKIHIGLGAARIETKELRRARSHLENAFAIASELGDRRVEGAATGLLADVAVEEGRPEEAEAMLQRVLALRRQTGDRYWEAHAWRQLGEVALERLEAETAERCFGAGATLFQASGDRKYAAIARAGRAVAVAMLGHIDEATFALEDTRASLTGEPDAALVEILAAFLDLARGQPDRAHRLLAEAPEPSMPRSRIESAALHALARMVEPRPAAAARPQRSTRPPPELAIASDGRGFTRAGRAPVNLQRRGALSRILRALVDRRPLSATTALSIDALLGAGWPGERVEPEVGATRVYNAIQRLRRLGLDGVLITRDDGYLLDPAVPIAVDPTLTPEPVG
jgi:predicted ATPase/Tfp pilus assembly protein PilF